GPWEPGPGGGGRPGMPGVGSVGCAGVVGCAGAVGCATGTCGVEAFGCWNTQLLELVSPSKCRTTGGKSFCLNGSALLLLLTPLMRPVGSRTYSQSSPVIGSLYTFRKAGFGCLASSSNVSG